MQVEVDPEKVVVEPFQERCVEGGRVWGLQRVGRPLGDLHVLTETQGAEGGGGVRKPREALLQWVVRGGFHRAHGLPELGRRGR